MTAAALGRDGERPSIGLRGRLGALATPTAAAIALTAVCTAVVSAVSWQRLHGPLWYDEQWRAFQVVLPPGPWHNLRGSTSPSALGYLLIERAMVSLFGSTEFALRAPALIALPFLGWGVYRLARRIVPAWWALAAVPLTVLNVPLLVLGVQTKPYILEAAAAVWLVETLARLGEAERARTVATGYLTAALLTIIALPVIFLLPALLAWDVARSRRLSPAGRRFHLLGALGVAAAATAHLALFIRPQAVNSPESYWTGSFLPTHSVHAATSFFVRQLPWFPRALSTAGNPPPNPGYRSVLVQSFSGPFPVLCVLAVAGCLLLGLWVMWQSHALRPVGTALATAVVLQLAASAAHAWPFGMNRTNLFLLPLLVVAFLAGLHALLGWTFPLRRAGSAVSRLAAGGTALFAVCALAFSGIRFAQLAGGAPLPALFADLRSAVLDVRSQAGPADVVLLAVPAANQADAERLALGWRYYARLYDGIPQRLQDRPGVDDARTLVRSGLPATDAIGFLDDHPAAQRVFILELRNWGPERYAATLATLQNRGWCQAASHRYPTSGLLLELDRCCPSRPSGASPGRSEPPRRAACAPAGTPEHR